MVKIFSILVAFLENMNFTITTSMHLVLFPIHTFWQERILEKLLNLKRSQYEYAEKPEDDISYRISCFFVCFLDQYQTPHQ